MKQRLFIRSLIVTALFLITMYTFAPATTYSNTATATPNLNHIEVLTKQVKAGEPVHYLLEINDHDKGIQTISVSARNKAQTHFVHSAVFEVSEEKKNQYIAKSHPITTSAAVDEWEIYSVVVMDKTGNFIHLQEQQVQTPFTDVYFNTSVLLADDEYKEFKSFTDAALDKTFKVKFSKKYNPNTIHSNNIVLLDENRKVIPLTFTIDKETMLSITITPTELLQPNTSYTMYIQNIESASGRKLHNNIIFQVHTKP